MRLAYLRMIGSDIQNNNGVFLASKLTPNDEVKHLFTVLTPQNIIPFSIYFTARKCIEHTWLNDRDQYLWPKDDWKDDLEFQSDCLCYTIFSRSNNIKSADGVNHWIPFREAEVDAKEKYASHFLLDYLAGKWRPAEEPVAPPQPDFLATLSSPSPALASSAAGEAPAAPLTFSPAAQAVFDAAREVWRYYHAQPKANPNASYYEIREHFQGRNAKGTMNSDSPDAHYTALMESLKAAYSRLAAQIEPKIYRYGFLLR